MRKTHNSKERGEVMRKDMRKLVRLTEIKSARIQMVDGEPVAEKLDDEIVFGTYDMEKAQRHMEKLYNDNKVTVLEITHKKIQYKAMVKDFMEIAEIVNEEII